jgi:hypothetical protein
VGQEQAAHEHVAQQAKVPKFASNGAMLLVLGAARALHGFQHQDPWRGLEVLVAIALPLQQRGGSGGSRLKLPRELAVAARNRRTTRSLEHRLDHGRTFYHAEAHGQRLAMHRADASVAAPQRHPQRRHLARPAVLLDLEPRARGKSRLVGFTGQEQLHHACGSFNMALPVTAAITPAARSRPRGGGEINHVIVVVVTAARSRSRGENL